MARLKIKHGDAEFEAEGDPAEIQAQYAAFLDLLKLAPAQQTPKSNTPMPADGQGAGGEDRELLNRIFVTGKDGAVTLRVLPPGERRDADALLLLLYGAHRLGGMQNVFGAYLGKVARMSGVQIDRIDRVIDAHSQYFVRGGFKRGATYTLNNQGYLEAERIMKTVFP